MRFFEEWRQALDSGKKVGALLIDLSKAFDCLPHHLFVPKLRLYQMSKEATLFLCNYLSMRLQRVKVFRTLNDWDLTIKGLPQG